jgi:hypothetical protein
MGVVIFDNEFVLEDLLGDDPVLFFFLLFLADTVAFIESSVLAECSSFE